MFLCLTSVLTIIYIYITHISDMPRYASHNILYTIYILYCMMLYTSRYMLYRSSRCYGGAQAAHSGGLHTADAAEAEVVQLVAGTAWRLPILTARLLTARKRLKRLGKALKRGL